MPASINPPDINADGTKFVYDLMYGTYAIPLAESSRRDASLMGEDTLTLVVEKLDSDNTIPVYVGSRTLWQGIPYTLHRQPEVTRLSSKACRYTYTFESPHAYLASTIMRHTVLSYPGGNTSSVWWSDGGDGRISFSLTATPREHLQMICDNINRIVGYRMFMIRYSDTLGMEQRPDAYSHIYYKDYGYPPCFADEGEEKCITYDGVTCLEALQSLAETYETEWRLSMEEPASLEEPLTDRVFIHLGPAYVKGNPIVIGYGSRGGINASLQRRNDDSAKPITTLYIKGGDQNIPEHYGQTPEQDENGNYTGRYTANDTDIASKTLLLPRNTAVLYDGTNYYFIQNPDIVSESYNPENAKVGRRRYVKDTVYRNSQGILMHEHLLDNDGNPIDYELFIGSIRCYLTSADGRSLTRVHHTYYDPTYNPPYERPVFYDPTWCSPQVYPEAFLDASDIYPARVGVVAGVKEGTAQDEDGNDITVYDIYDTDPTCPNYTDHYAEGETMTIVFQDGMLAGREFDLNTWKSGTNADKPVCELEEVYDARTGDTLMARRLEICPAQYDGLLMPSGNFIPRAGDRYIIFHCRLPYNYIAALPDGAEYQALRKLTHHLYLYGQGRDTITAKPEAMWVKEKWQNYKHCFQPAGKVHFIDGILSPEGRDLRVTAINQSIHNPYAINLTLSEVPIQDKGWQRKIARTVRKVLDHKPNLKPLPSVPPNPTYTPHTETLYRTNTEASQAAFSI